MGCTPSKTLFYMLQFYIKFLCQFAFCANIHSCLFSFYIYLPSAKKNLTFLKIFFDLIYTLARCPQWYVIPDFSRNQRIHRDWGSESSDFILTFQPADCQVVTI